MSHEFRQMSSEQFIASIISAIRSGFGVCPLLGSGISSASGIIMGREFADYLAYCVYSALDSNRRWDVRQDGWLPYPNPEEYETAREWTYSEYSKICSANGYEIVKGSSDHTIDAIVPIVAEDRLIDFSASKALNCPPIPSNIRSGNFKYFDDSIQRLANSIRSNHSSTDPYEPLWPRQEQSKSSKNWINELGIRSLSDWRLTLRFLSRIRQEHNPNRTILTDPEPSVIDRFNTFITSDKQPNLAHKMLASLSRPLRMRTLLTTNFDTLLEDAFLVQGHALTKFFVSTHGQLPDPFLVRAQPSIIKLHGELLETRADLSLDAEPEQRDKDKFLQYFFSVSARREKLQSMPAHLFVMGFSASDMRIIRLIQYMLDETQPYPASIRPQVFWICHNQRDVSRIESLFPVDVYHDRLAIHPCNRPDLLLLELYQRASLSLPIAGHTYEYNHNVPPSRMNDRANAIEEGFDQCLERSREEVYLRDASILDEVVKSNSVDITLDKRLDARDSLARIAGHTLFARHEGTVPSDGQRLVNRMYAIVDKNALATRNRGTWGGIDCPPQNILFFNTTCGALESLSILHAKILKQPGKNCLWFELADYIDTDSLLRDILRSIAIRTGRFQREHVLLHPLDAPISFRSGSVRETRLKLSRYFQKLCDVHHLSPSRWTIILYGRDVAGTCVNWEGTEWRREDWDCLSILIGALGQSGFRVVFAFPTAARIISEHKKQITACGTIDTNKIKTCRENASEAQAFHNATYSEKVPEEAEIPFPNYYENLDCQSNSLSVFREIHKVVMERCDRDAGFAEFLYAVCLFRQSRRPSALFYEAVQPCKNRFNLHGIDNDLWRSRRAMQWVRFLEKNRVFYKKAGGHSWMHRDIRLALRRSLDCRINGNAGGESMFCHRLARMHFWIGDWYEKAFLATGFAKPMLECLHHRFQAALSSVYSVPTDLIDRHDPDALQHHRALLFRYSVISMTKSLLVSRQYLKLWLANIHGFGMFNGDARGKVMDRLNHVAKQLESPQKTSDMREIIDEFQVALIETDRSIRREADLSYSGYAVPMSMQNPAATLHEKVRQDLDAVLGATYTQASQWTDSLERLFTSAGTQFRNGCVELLRDAMTVETASGVLKFHPGEYARRKGIAIDQMASEFGNLLPFLCLVEGLAYAQLRRAKYRSHEAILANPKAPLQVEVRSEWLKVTRLCNLGIDWCKHLRVGCFAMDCELRVRMHTYYAVALANLDRFFEAHRRINEANGINSKRELPASQVELAKLGIRRAEVLLTEAHRLADVLDVLRTNQLEWLKGSSVTEKRNFRSLFEEKGTWTFSDSRVGGSNEHADPVRICIHPSAAECIPDATISPEVYRDAVDALVRLLIATLDDAWFAIENAERLLSGRSQSSLWWGRVALMKLRAFGYQAHVFGPKDYEEMRMLPYRHRRINPQVMIRIFENAMLNNGGNLYRELRLIRYMAMCLVSFAKCGDDLPSLEKMAAELDRQLKSRKSLIRDEMKSIYELATEGCKSARTAIRAHRKKA